MNAIFKKENNIGVVFCDKNIVGTITSKNCDLISKEFEDDLTAYAAWHDAMDVTVKNGWRLLYISSEYNDFEN
jgi:hypothetical protein